MADTSSVSPNPTRIYRWFDADGVLLYVGISMGVIARTKAHIDDSPWTQFAARMEIEPIVPTSRAEAEQMERDRIRDERPIFNRADSDEWWIRQEAYLLMHGVEVSDDLEARFLSMRDATEQAETRAAARAARTFDQVHQPGIGAELRAAARLYPWPSGRTAVRDRAVLHALIDAAAAVESSVVSVTLRTVLSNTPYTSVTSIYRAIGRLEAAGWVKILSPRGTYSLPSTYQITIPPTPTGRDPVYLWHNIENRPSTSMGMAFTPHAAAVYAALSPEEGQTVAEIVEASGVSRRTVHRWLPELAKRGLARWTDKKGWLLGDTDPDSVAEDKDVLDAALKKLTRHELQREGFRQWHADRDAARARRSRG